VTRWWHLRVLGHRAVALSYSFAHAKKLGKHRILEWCECGEVWPR
jgi:hypothetical protein